MRTLQQAILTPSQLLPALPPEPRGLSLFICMGHPVDMDPLMELARRHGLFVVEDAAEAHGAEYKGKKTGSIGDIGVFSFYGNKLITTGEGGMLTTNDDSLAARIRLLRSQGMDPGRRFWHSVIGYNYRMTNIQAAIGLAQLEQVDNHINSHIGVARMYNSALSDLPGLTLPIERPWGKHVYWLYTIILDESLPDRDEVMRTLATAGIETRPVFYPSHLMPPYQHLASGAYPIAERLARQGLNLPTYDDLSKEDIDLIRDVLETALVGRKGGT